MVVPRLLAEVVEGLAARAEVEAVEIIPGPEGWTVWVFGTPVPLGVRKDLLTPRATVLELDAPHRPGIDAGELNDGTKVSLEYLSLDGVVDGLAAVVDRAQITLGVTTRRWHQFNAGEVKVDRTGRLTAARARFAVPYPEALKRAVVQAAWPRLTTGWDSLRSQAASALTRGDWVTVQHRTAAFLTATFELVWAANGQTHPGDLGLVAQSQTLPALPSDWAGLLGAVDRAVGMARPTLPDTLDRLAEALRVVLVRQGLLDAPPPRAPKASPPAAPAAPLAPTPSGPLTVYTDGGCIGNPGKGAWAYLVDDGTLRVEDTGGEPLTTNNKMELQGVIEALRAIHGRADWQGRPIRIHTDSQYVRNGITTWIKTWAANGWKTAAKEPVKNQDLWVQLQKWDALLKPEWKWVKGHAGNPNNERCDQLVRRTMDQM